MVFLTFFLLKKDNKLDEQFKKNDFEIVLPSYNKLISYQQQSQFTFS